jgi:hypothetical protein
MKSSERDCIKISNMRRYHCRGIPNKIAVSREAVQGWDPQNLSSNTSVKAIISFVLAHACDLERVTQIELCGNLALDSGGNTG